MKNVAMQLEKKKAASSLRINIMEAMEVQHGNKTWEVMEILTEWVSETTLR